MSSTLNMIALLQDPRTYLPMRGTGRQQWVEHPRVGHEFVCGHHLTSMEQARGAQPFARGEHDTELCRAGRAYFHQLNARMRRKLYRLVCPQCSRSCWLHGPDLDCIDYNPVCPFGCPHDNRRPRLGLTEPGIWTEGKKPNA